jgi:branched-chain amino acid transport system permease protein
MDLLIQQISSGLANGAIYACVALALVMIYTATEHVNFAQGEMAMLSTYICWSLIGFGLPYPVAFIATVVLSFGYGVVIERVVLRPLAGAPALSLIIVFIGLLLTFNSAAGWIWGYYIKEFPSPVAGWSTGTSLVGSHELLVMAVTLVLLVGIFAFFRYTPLGVAMRAAAQNPVSARLSGVRVNSMLSLGWGLAAAVGAVAGMMVAPIVFLDPNMMANILLYAFAAALLGGITSPGGAVVGGLAVGVLENLVGTYLIGDELKLTVALGIVVAVLLVRPSGLFGEARIERV